MSILIQTREALDKNCTYGRVWLTMYMHRYTNLVRGQEDYSIPSLLYIFVGMFQLAPTKSLNSVVLKWAIRKVVICENAITTVSNNSVSGHQWLRGCAGWSGSSTYALHRRHMYHRCWYIVVVPPSTLRKHAYSNILNILPPKKWKFSDKKLWYFSYFCSKHRLWVLVRTASPRRF